MMFFRILGVAWIGGLILWQSGCLAIRDGQIINRCGLWQWATSTQITFARVDLKPAPPSPPAHVDYTPHYTNFPATGPMPSQDRPRSTGQTTTMSYSFTTNTSGYYVDFGQRVR